MSLVEFIQEEIIMKKKNYCHHQWDDKLFSEAHFFAIKNSHNCVINILNCSAFLFNCFRNMALIIIKYIFLYIDEVLIGLGRKVSKQVSVE